MKWVDLDLKRMVEIERQVDEVCRTYDMLTLQLARQQRTPSSNPAQLAKALDLLTKSIAERVASMEAFYHEHDLEPGAAKLEANRVKLKRVLLAARASGNMSSSLGSTTTSAGGGGNNVSSSVAVQQQRAPVDEPSPAFSPIHSVSLAAAATVTAATTPQSLQPPALHGALDFSLAAGEQVASIEESVLVRIVFTQEEFDDLLLRRETIKQMLGGSTRRSAAEERKRGVRNH